MTLGNAIKEKSGAGGPGGAARGRGRCGQRSLTRVCQLERWWHWGEVAGGAVTKGHCPWGPPAAQFWGSPKPHAHCPGGPTTGSSWLQRVFHHPGGCWHWRRDTSGVGDVLWGPAVSPALLLPAGCLLSVPPKKNPDMGHRVQGTQCVPMLQGALEMFGAEPLTRLPASVSPAQPRAASPARREVWEGC